LTVCSVTADEVRLSSGRILSGVIEDESDLRVEIVVAGGNRITIPRREIAEVVRAGEGPNALLMGNLHLEQEMLWETAQYHSQALDLGVPAFQIAEALLANPTAVITLLESEQEDRALEERNLFLRVLSGVPPEDRLLHLAGRMCDVTGDRARAKDAFEQIDPVWWFRQAEARGAVAQFYREEARLALDRDDYEGVLAAFQQLMLVDPGLASDLSPVFYIQLANLQFDQGQWADALEIVGEMVQPEAPEIAGLYLESRFDELEHMALSGESISEVVSLFERHIGRFFPENAEGRLAKLHLAHGEQLLAEGQFPEARAAFNRHYDLVGADGSDRPRALAATLVERAARLDPEDWDGQIRVAVEMIENELWDDALRQISRLEEVEDHDVRVFVHRQREAIRGRQAVESYDRAFDLYDRGDYAGALDVLTRDAALFRSRRLQEEVSKLRVFCQQRLNTLPGQNAALALAQYQQAERHVYRGRYEAAIPILESLLDEFADAPVARQAEGLLNTTRFRLAVTRPSGEGFRLPETDPSSPQLLRREFEELLSALEDGPAIGP
jgi:tetratricopeptide (TPR) repeat protein